MNSIKAIILPICLQCNHLFQIERLSLNKQYNILITYKCQCNHSTTVFFDKYYSSLKLISLFYNEKCDICKRYSKAFYCFTCNKVMCKNCINKNTHKHIVSSIKVCINKIKCKCIDTINYCEQCEVEYCTKCNKEHNKH